MTPKNKKFLTSAPFLATIAYMLVFHCFFGTNEAWLYLPNVSASILLVLGYGLSTIKHKTISKIVTYSLLGYVFATLAGSINLLHTIINKIIPLFPLAEGSVYAEFFKGIAFYFVVVGIVIGVSYLIKYLKRKMVDKKAKDCETSVLEQ